MHAGHVEIQQCQLQRVVTNGRLHLGQRCAFNQADVTSECFLHHVFERLPEQGVVIGNQYTHIHHESASQDKAARR